MYMYIYILYELRLEASPPVLRLWLRLCFLQYTSSRTYVHRDIKKIHTNDFFFKYHDLNLSKLN